MYTPKMHFKNVIDQSQAPHEKCMTRFYQKFVLVPKLSLRRQLGELGINKKYRVWTSASLQEELYLNAFHPFFHVLNGL
jgi:hypothetical protein